MMRGYLERSVWVFEYNDAPRYPKGDVNKPKSSTPTQETKDKLRKKRKTKK